MTFNPRPLRSGRLKPGPEPRLSREAIAEAVIAVGFQNLTITAVADHLQTRHSALYRYVQDRDDLVVAAIDLLVSRTSWPGPSGDWRDWLEQQAWALWQLFEAHPGLVEAMRSSQRTPLGMARHVSNIGTGLLDHGFTLDSAVIAVDMVVGLVADTAIRLSVPQSRIEEQLQEREGHVPEDIIEKLRQTRNLGPRSWLRAKLPIILDGIDARLKAGQPPFS